MRSTLTWIATVALVFGLALALPPVYRQWKRADADAQIDYLRPLRKALNPAAATALTSKQEKSIRVLIARFRASRTDSIAHDPVDAARRAYCNAIVAGQEDAAVAQIPTIVNGITESASARLQRNAAFAIGIIEVLDQNQVSALVQQFGAAGVVRLLEFLGTAPALEDMGVLPAE